MEHQAFHAVVWFGSSPTPTPVSKLSLVLSLPVSRRSSLVTQEGGGSGGGDKSYDGEKAWSSINHSILFGLKILSMSHVWFVFNCKMTTSPVMVLLGQKLYMKETPRRWITVTSSLNQISTDQLGNRVVKKGGRRYSARPHPFLQQDFLFLDSFLKTTWTVFPPPRIFASLSDASYKYQIYTAANYPATLPLENAWHN